MKKLTMKTPDITSANIDKIAALFPHVVTEKEGGSGQTEKAVDFDLLRQTLQKELVEDDSERYRLDWPGKKASLLKANTPISKTLRPDRDSSVNFDTTENLFIEGDNFEVLKILQESYLGKVKMIYIDPPYNTGKDFVYKDNFKQSREEYEEELGVEDEDGGKLIRNTDTNGRFHSDWLSMMYERLLIARDLLQDDGVIYISINDCEFANLRKICDEVYGEVNSLTESPTTLVWQGSGSTAGHFANAHEYILCYAKNKKSLPFFNVSDYGDNSVIAHGALKKISKANPASQILFPAGVEFDGKDSIFSGTIGGSEKQIITGEMIFKNGMLVHPVNITAGWAMKDQILSWLQGHETYDSKGQKIIKFYFNKEGILWYQKERGTIHPKTILDKSVVGSTKTGSSELNKLMGFVAVDFPKPVSLLKFLISFTTNNNDVILDFFAGSATTAHAVMAQNAEDGGNRKFIMVQIPEETPEDSEARKAGYETISQIGMERIRRAGKKIQEEQAEKLLKERETPLDVGFRVYRADTTNMKDIYYHPNELTQGVLAGLAGNIKEDRTAEDLLTQVLLDLGLELSLPIEPKDIRGHTVYLVDGNALVACFDDNIDFSIVDDIAKLEPLKVVFKDAGFKDDKDRINVETRFKQLSPDTLITVL